VTGAAKRFLPRITLGALNLGNEAFRIVRDQPGAQRAEAVVTPRTYCFTSAMPCSKFQHVEMPRQCGNRRSGSRQQGMTSAQVHNRSSASAARLSWSRGADEGKGPGRYRSLRSLSLLALTLGSRRSERDPAIADSSIPSTELSVSSRLRHLLSFTSGPT
jgi:hypothetical protein